MKTLFIGLLYALTLVAMLSPSLGKAATKSKASRAHVARATQSKLSTSMAFNGSRVDGQYQLPSEATAKIENEKPIEELLGLRTQFRDRMKLDEERN